MMYATRKAKAIAILIFNARFSALENGSDFILNPSVMAILPPKAMHSIFIMLSRIPRIFTPQPPFTKFTSSKYS